MKNNLHEKVFQFLEECRKENPDFFYWLRQRDRKKKDTGKSKLSEGTWFQGNDDYAFVGLYNRSGGSNMTRSVGLVFYEKDEKLGGRIEIVYNEEQDQAVIDFYQELMDVVGGFESIGEVKFQKNFRAVDFEESVKKFLTNVKPKIDELIRQKSLEHLFITKEKFEKAHHKILNFRKVIEEDENNNLKSSINLYKDLLKNKFPDETYEEFYKWETIQHFQDNWKEDHTAENILDNLKQAYNKRNNNLWSGSHYLPYQMMLEFAEAEPAVISEMFHQLYDEEQEVFSRIKNFQKESKGLLTTTRPGEDLDHYQSKRAIMVYLVLKYPDKYYLYKNGMYNDFCKITKFREKPGSSKRYNYDILVSYKDMCDEVRSILISDQELLDLHKKLLPDHITFQDDSHLLTQDFIYCVTTYLKQQAESSDFNYWIFQGNPKLFDFKTALEEEILDDWIVSAHKDKIKLGDKVILWITGPNAGCYALATVTKEPHKKEFSADSHLWKEENKTELKANIQITHNLVANPILKSTIEKYDNLSKLKVGNQGTNFSASKEEFQTILTIAENMKNKRCWLFAPGTNASHWNEFYEKGIFALGWDDLGDLNQYENKNAIVKKLQTIHDTTSSKKNDATANYEFCKGINIGDIVIVKSGKRSLLGYGQVISDHYFDDQRKDFKNCRRIKWIKKGEWKTDFDLATKTLTDVSNYPTEHPGYDKYHKRLLGIMNEDSLKIDNMNHPLNQILFGPPGTGKTYSTIDKVVEILEPDQYDSTDHDANKIIYESLLAEDRVTFTTFHQSMTYEDFVEGIKPIMEEGNDRRDVGYKIQDGIFKRICKEALSTKKITIRPDESEVKLTREIFKDYYHSFVEQLPSHSSSESQFEYKTPTDKNSFCLFKNSNNSIVVKAGSKMTPMSLSFNELSKVLFEDKSPLYSSYEKIVIEQILKEANFDEQEAINTNKKYALIIDEI